MQKDPREIGLDNQPKLVELMMRALETEQANVHRMLDFRRLLFGGADDPKVQVGPSNSLYEMLQELGGLQAQSYEIANCILDRLSN